MSGPPVDRIPHRPGEHPDPTAIPPKGPHPPERRLLDLLGLMAAVLLGLPALLYPFGLDQSLFAYIGRGWLHGAMPYADSFDHKPPGIHLVYALAAFGGGNWQGAIRLVELLSLLLCGWLIANVLRGDKNRRDGELGAAVLLLSGFYYTCFDFWEGGQVEFWEGFFLTAAFAAAVRRGTSRWRAVLSGALAGCAVVFKYPAVLVAVGIAGVCVWRGAHGKGAFPSTGRRVRHAAATMLLFGLSASGVLALALLPFAVRGALWQFWDATVLFNLQFADQVGRAIPARLFFTRQALPYTIAGAVCIGMGVAALARDRLQGRRRAGHAPWIGAWSVVLLLLAYTSVVVQKKFWFYHYGVLVPFAVAVMLWGIDRFFARRARRVFLAAVIIVAVGFAAAPPWPANEYRAIQMSYRDHAIRSGLYLSGAMSRTEFMSVFVHYNGFNYLGAERLAQMVRMHAGPDDTVWVVGFNPIVYWVSGLRCPSRFFTTHVLIEAQGGYRDGAWLKEHREAIHDSPPTFVVVRQIHVPRWLESGYLAVGELGGWIVLRRSAAP